PSYKDDIGCLDIAWASSWRLNATPPDQPSKLRKKAASIERTTPKAAVAGLRSATGGLSAKMNRREQMKHIKTLIAAGGIAAASIVSAYAIDISGAGATFPYPIYAKWAVAYKGETGNGL